jgi:hypothetical protein
MTHVQIQFAIDDPQRADDIVEALLAARLVACGQRTGTGGRAGSRGPRSGSCS